MRNEYESYLTLEVSQNERLLTVSLNRPDSLNAVGGGMHEELEHLWSVVRRDRSVGAIFLRGNGRAFCAGGDVRRMAKRTVGEAVDDLSPPERAAELLISAKTIISNMLDVDQPIVCAVRGYAMGLGATIALCADVMIAADDAVLADRHVSMGLVAGDGGAVIWPLLMPINTAKYYLMSGDRISGADAVRMGLALRSAPSDKVDEVARQIATKLANGPSLALRFTKATVNKILRERLNLLFDTGLMMESITIMSADHKEAMRAFAEKRPPVFIGR